MVRLRSSLFSWLPIILILIGISSFICEFLRYGHYLSAFLPSIFPYERELDPIVLLLSSWLILFGFYGRKRGSRALFIISCVFMVLWVLVYAYGNILEQVDMAFDQKEWSSRTILFYMVSLISFWGLQKTVFESSHQKILRNDPLRSERLFDERIGPFFLFLILIGVAVAYAPLVKNGEFRRDDFIFIAQIEQYGLIKSLMIPHMDHFLPFYRIFMGGLYCISRSGKLIRGGILAFHLINTCLVFSIVRAHSKSVLLPAIAALAFGFSYECSSCITWCILGHWVISMTFVLLMSMCFDKFIQDISDHPVTDQVGFNLNFKYYFAGLICFTLALGTYTLAFFGGPIIWLFMYGRMLQKRVSRKFYNHAVILFPFLGILALYLGLRALSLSLYLPVRGFPFVLKDILAAAVSFPGAFYLNALKKMLPQLTGGYLLIYFFLLFLLIKGLFSKSKEASYAGLWLSFGILILVLPIVTRLPIYLAFSPTGRYEDILHGRYFYFPITAISIASGLLFDSLPPVRAVKGFLSARLAKLLAVSVFILSFVVVYPSALRIRATIAQVEKEDFSFSQDVASYKMAMTAFLNSPKYSPNEMFYFEDGLLDQWFPHNWLVKKSIIFKLYFTDVENVLFTKKGRANEKVYQWTSTGVLGPDSSPESDIRMQVSDEQKSNVGNEWPTI